MESPLTNLNRTDAHTRRAWLRTGAIGVGSLTLAGFAGGEETPRAVKSVIMVVLAGGPSHIDLYDLKPQAPAEIRGEFQPIQSKVPGMHLGELLPRQAAIADKLAIVRSFQVEQDLQHALHEVYTGFAGEANKAFPGGAATRPAIGSVISQLRRNVSRVPPYVSLRDDYTSRAVGVAEDPAYLGTAHGPFVPSGLGMRNLDLPPGVSGERLADRRALLKAFDSVRRKVEAQGDANSIDTFTAQALELITSARVQKAFDVRNEPEYVRRAYGPATQVKSATENKLVSWNPLQFLQARRLVEAGVPFVTLVAGDWDHHSATGAPQIFEGLRSLVPAYDQALAALIEDLHARGLDRDVLVLVWGEFGRTPRISERAGRDHWPPAGCVLLAGGGLKMGQVIGATDRLGSRPTTRPIGPQNVLATVYQHLGIDPATTLPDHRGRPMSLLEEREPIVELV